MMPTPMGMDGSPLRNFARMAGGRWKRTINSYAYGFWLLGRVFFLWRQWIGIDEWSSGSTSGMVIAWGVWAEGE
ncbi:hypothetical protein [Zoogloea sp.]|uniref:hypothetical protein n=1 Tax=Zoogloea sp. TaxID=49181 RepID=UPI0014156619|nr:MAG: hypothetical protein F9K15_06160 [Zoogloea sp.]